MKKIIYFISILACVTSCNDWLNVESNTLVTDEDILAHPELVEAQFLTNYSDLRKSIQCIGDGGMSYKQHHLDVYTDDGVSNSPWENAITRNNTPGKVFGGIFSQSSGESY